MNLYFSYENGAKHIRLAMRSHSYAVKEELSETQTKTDKFGFDPF